MTSITCSGALEALLTDGRLTTLGFTKGAATIRITTSTSMTSMYGTTFISAIMPRRLVFPRRDMA